MMNMKKLWLSLLGLVLACNTFPQEYVSGELLVKFKGNSGVSVRRKQKGSFITTSNRSALDDVLSGIGAKDIQQLMPLSGARVQSGTRRAISSNRMVADADLSTLYVVRFDSLRLSVEDAMAKLRMQEEVECVEPNYVFRACDAEPFAPESIDDPLYAGQWALDAIRMPELWGMPMQDTRRPVIAILDTGVDVTHPDLKDNIWSGRSGDNGDLAESDDGYIYYQTIHGWDFVQDEPILFQKNDIAGHGTHCAGIAAASGGNGVGIVGANPDAQIMTVKVLAGDGKGSAANILRGIDFAIANGANVINMSFNGPNAHLVYETLLKAYAHGIISVAAAGNDGLSIYEKDGTSYPAAYDIVVGVMSCDRNGSRSSFSNYDPDGPFTFTTDEALNYEVYAPGGNIMSTYPDGNYKSLSGTSMATPLVAGAISRMMQIRGYDFAPYYAFIGDMAMSRQDGSLVFDAPKALTWTAGSRQAAIRLAGIRIDDSKLGNGNGQVDAGETFDIYPAVSSLWGHADNVEVHAELFDVPTDNPMFEILTNNVPLGKTIDTRGVVEGTCALRVRVKDNVRDGFVLPVHFTLSCDNEVDEASRQDFVRDLTINNRVEIGGLYTDELVLTPDVNYVVTKYILLDGNGKLTIQPGTTLRFKPGTGIISHSQSDVVINSNGTADAPVRFVADDDDGSMVRLKISINERLSETGDVIPDVLSNIIFQGFYESFSNLNFHQCVFKNAFLGWDTMCNFDECLFDNCGLNAFYPTGSVNHCTYANNNVSRFSDGMSHFWFDWLPITSCNFVGNKRQEYDYSTWTYVYYPISAYYKSEHPEPRSFEYPSYYGSADLDLVNSQKVDASTPEVGQGVGTLDLSNMLSAPSAEAPAIVWKVVVNGKDAQDEFSEMTPLSVGRHKFEVYFSRPVDKAYVPVISMGVRAPYTQTAIAEDGAWNEDGTVYTAWLEITPRLAPSLGIHTIRVSGARQSALFEVPVEDSRFRVQVETMGTMSSRLYAESGIGMVTLVWETDTEDLDDLMGYNIYRFTMDGDVSSDTVMVNTSLVAPEAVSFVDYDVTPGITYYYLIRQFTTGLEEINVTDAVHASPLSSIKGDSNGSSQVDVADVITDVAYLTFQNPKPFLFEAADVDGSGEVDILDIMTTVNMIVSPEAYGMQSADNGVATYTVADGMLTITSPVCIGGVQVGFTANGDAVEACDVLGGFEKVSTATLFLAYSMSGKYVEAGTHDYLYVGTAGIDKVVLSDIHGRNVPVSMQNPTGVTGIAGGNSRAETIYDLTGRPQDSTRLAKGLYIINNKKMLKQ